MKSRGDIAVIGLAVMGQNLILNMSDHGFNVVIFNRTVSKIDEFVNGAAKGRENIIPAYTIEEVVGKLKTPRKVMLMVKAGPAVEHFIELLVPHLSPGDLIIDGGNSHFKDTIRRTGYLESKGLLFVGTGISGGEEGARNGPSIMPGGSPEAWPLVEDIFKAICAKTTDGALCCDWIGGNGAGHYVKMIHNGIEYGDMQLIAEAYHLLREGLKLNNDEMSRIFAEWNRGELNSFLIDITSQVLTFKDDDGTSLVDKILDSAEQKGTGRWTSENSLALGIPLTLITEAVYARSLSALKEQRLEASKILGEERKPFEGNREGLVYEIGRALLASKIISYAQGFMLMSAAAKEYGWDLDLGSIALIWRGGCIIRSRFLGQINDAFDKDRGLANLLLDNYFKGLMDKCVDSWRKVVAAAVKAGIPVPVFSSALAFYDGYRSSNLPANLIQAQRDYFGAHMYERTDRPRGELFHTNWTQKIS